MAQVTPPPFAESAMQPAVPAGCVRTPVVVLREKIAIELFLETAYRFFPSGLRARETAPESPLPRAQVTPSPPALTQPCVPGSCVTTPVVVLRENVVTAELPK